MRINVYYKMYGHPIEDVPVEEMTLGDVLQRALERQHKPGWLNYAFEMYTHAYCAEETFDIHRVFEEVKHRTIELEEEYGRPVAAKIVVLVPHFSARTHYVYNGAIFTDKQVDTLIQLIRPPYVSSRRKKEAFTAAYQQAWARPAAGHRATDEEE